MGPDMDGAATETSGQLVQTSGQLVEASGEAGKPLTDRGRRTYQRLLTAAEQVFRERGYAGTRMQDVAAAAGVSHGTVYTWFASKDELLDGLAEVLRKRAFVHPDSRSDGSGPGDTREHVIQAPYDRLTEANQRFLTTYAQHARMLTVIEEAASADPRWLAALEDLRQAYVARTRRALRRWQQQGLVATDIDPELSAIALTGMSETFARRVVADSAPNSAPAVSVEEATEMISKLWARAVGMRLPEPAADDASSPSSDSAATNPVQSAFEQGSPA